ncbi:MAG TPA: gliding motility-associated protein GldE [Prolixibacteraceae bacterium]|nr:gliding motility-associated protein GldE [Prolixibacteraceae bacterium]
METDAVSFFETLNGDIGYNHFTSETLTGLFIVIVLLALSALISGSEVALFSLEPKEIKDLKTNKRHSASLVLKLLSEPQQLLAAILVGNNFVNIAIVLLTAHITNSLIDFSLVPTLGFIFNTVFITSLILLFGEIIPKVYAAHYPKTLALRVSAFINILVIITKPVNFLLINSTSFVNKRLLKYKKNLSIDEISKALQLTDHLDISDDKEILEGIVKFGNKSVNEIMRSRLEVTSIDIHSNFDRVLQIIKESGYSRIPVFAGTLDDVRGILYIKDLLPYLDKSAAYRWQSLMRQPFFVPETKKIDDLLEDFQKSKVHMAIVVDEFGGTSGLVTLEDILEEIVGDIADEFDEDELLFTQVSEFEFLFDGKIMLNDFCKVFDYEDDIFDDIRGEADTLAGLILELKGEFPMLHEKLNCKNFAFEVEGVNTRRITKIKVTILPESKTESL